MRARGQDTPRVQLVRARGQDTPRARGQDTPGTVKTHLVPGVTELDGTRHDKLTMLKLTCWACGTNPSTLGQYSSDVRVVKTNLAPRGQDTPRARCDRARRHTP